MKTITYISIPVILILVMMAGLLTPLLNRPMPNISFPNAQGETSVKCLSSNASNCDPLTNEDQFNKAFDNLIATHAAATLPDTAIEQKNMKGKNGTIFTVTLVSNATGCYMNLFVPIKYMDINRFWMQNLPDSVVNHKGPCTVFDWFTLWQQLGRTIIETVKQLGIVGNAYNSYVWATVQDIILVASEALDRVSLGIFR